MYSSPSSLRFSPALQSGLLFLGLPAQHMVISPWSSTGLRLLQRPPFCIILLIITICYTGFYLFVPGANLLSTSSLTCPCPLLHYWVWCILALHVVLLSCNSAGLQLPPSYCFVLDYLFINQILSFLSPTYLMYVLSFVLLSQSMSLSLSLSLAAITTTLSSIQLVATNWDFSLPTLSLWKFHTGATGFLFDSWTLRMRPIGCPTT